MRRISKPSGTISTNKKWLLEQCGKDRRMSTSSSEISVSKLEEQRKSKIRQRFIADRLVPDCIRILIILAIVILWQVGTNVGILNSFTLGSPSGIWASFVSTVQDGSIFIDFGSTLYSTVIGFIIGSLVGVIAGLSLWFSPWVMKLVDPIIVMLNGLPKIALGPLIVIWFGSGKLSKIILAAFATFIIALLNSCQGALKVDSEAVSLVQSMGASKKQVFAKVIVPSAMPWIISAFRVNVGLALLAVIGGEFISADNGLGRKAAVSGNLYDLNGIWVSVILILVMAVLLNGVVSWLSRQFEKLI